MSHAPTGHPADIHTYTQYMGGDLAPSLEGRMMTYFKVIDSVSLFCLSFVCLYTALSEILIYVGRGGALVESMTFNGRVVDSTPALAAM